MTEYKHIVANGDDIGGTEEESWVAPEAAIAQEKAEVVKQRTNRAALAAWY